MTQLWIVGCYKPLEGNPEELSPRWEFVGVFDSLAKARAACLDWKYFVGPAALNVSTPEETTEWPGIEWPAIREVTDPEWQAYLAAVGGAEEADAEPVSRELLRTDGKGFVVLEKGQ